MCIYTHWSNYCKLNCVYCSTFTYTWVSTLLCFSLWHCVMCLDYFFTSSSLTLPLTTFTLRCAQERSTGTLKPAIRQPLESPPAMLLAVDDRWTSAYCSSKSVSPIHGIMGLSDIIICFRTTTVFSKNFLAAASDARNWNLSLTIYIKAYTNLVKEGNIFTNQQQQRKLALAIYLLEDFL